MTRHATPARALLSTFVVLVAAAVPLALDASSAAGGTSVASRVAASARVRTATQERARPRMAAWVVGWDTARVRTSLRLDAPLLGQVSPFWFQLAPKGDGIRNGEGAWDAEVLRIARTNDVKVVPTISNEFDRARVSKMLGSRLLRRRHVIQLVRLVDRPVFSGLDVDYENLAVADRARFARFVEDLADALHAKGKTLSVSVPAVTSAADGERALATDYDSIGEHADEVRVMAYDYHWSCGGAGPVAPIDWVEQVVKFAYREMPARKILLGIPLYGYDWPRTGCATSRTWRDSTAIRTRTNATVGWSVPFQSRVMRYRGRLVWFEDAASSEAKAKLAAEYGLKGIAAWRLGGEDPRTFRRLAEVLGAEEGQ